MASPEVRIQKGDDRHTKRYFYALRELVRALQASGRVDELLKKFEVEILEDGAINLDFPADFDQSTLPEDLR